MSDVYAITTAAGIDMITKSLNSGASASVTGGSSGITVSVNSATWEASAYGATSGTYHFSRNGSNWSSDENSTATATSSNADLSPSVDNVTFAGTDLGLLNGSYVFTCTADEEVWTYNSTNVSLSDYGISYTGSANDGDTITIAYSRSTVTLANIGIVVTGTAASGDRITVVYAKNEQINFTRFGFGDGAKPSNPSSLTSLVSEKVSTAIRSFSKETNFVNLGTFFDNSTVEEQFVMREIGVYATSPSYPTDTLFAYVNQEDQSEIVLADSNNKMMENDISLQIILDTAANVTATVASLTYATLAQLEEHTSNVSNPHNVTKAQLGLSNVENVAVEDGTVTYTIAEANATLTSGETVKAAFAKIARAVSSLISHLSNTSNPHSVTASQIGAAASSHNHGAGDITSGTLAVGRGGTGKSTWTANGIAYANTSTSLSQVSVPTAESFVMQNNGAPYTTAKATVFTSPAFTGTPTAPTATAGTSTTQIATTAFVATAISGKANLASPALTGTPTAPTAATTVNTTQIATTAHVKSMINRTTAVNVADTAYTTYMARGEALNSTDTTPTVNGTISWTYE